MAAAYILIILIVSLIYKEIECEEQQLEALEKKLQVLEQKLLDMESKQQQDENKLIALENKQHTESRKLHHTIDTVNEVKEENLHNMEQMRVNKGLLLDTIDKLSTTVAFTATMAGGAYRPVPRSPSILPFNNVQVNIGNAYSGSTYKFTCPVSGMYYFSFSVHSDDLRAGTDAYQSSAYIYHGSHRVTGGTSATHDRDSTMYAQTAASAVIRCDVGEHVEVRPSSPRENKFYGLPSWPDSTFTGFLISPQ